MRRATFSCKRSRSDAHLLILFSFFLPASIYSLLRCLKVLAAGRHVLEHLQSLGTVFDPAHPWENGVLAANCGVHCLPFMEGRNDITHSPAVLGLLESPEIRVFFDRLFGEPSRSFDFKWLRAVHRQAFTGAHTDSVYMSRGSQVGEGRHSIET